MNTQFLKLSSLLLLLMIFFVACDPDDENDDPTDDNEEVIDCGFFPLSVGSWWQYEEKTFTGDTVIYTKTVSPDTRAFYGKYYTTITFDTISDEQYLFCENNEYFEAGESFVYDSGTFDLPFLKLDEEVGSTWTYTYTYSGANNHYVYEVLSKGETHTVKGVEYENVTLIKRSYGLGLEAGPSDEELDRVYYAAGVGMIEYGSTSLDIQRFLMDYEIQ